MSKITNRALLFTVITGGLTLLGATAANADDTDGTHSVGGGNQISPTVTAPVTISGTTLAVLGDATGTTGPTGTPAASGGVADAHTDGSWSVLGGNQIAPTVTIPITVTGTTVAVLGDATGATRTSQPSPAGSPGAAPSPTTDGSHSVLGGNQVAPALTAPITLTGTTAAVLGDATGTTTGSPTVPAAGPTGSSGWTTDGSHSVLGGNQIVPVLIAPITLTGTTVAVLGDATGTTSPATPATPTVPAVAGSVAETDGTPASGGTAGTSGTAGTGGASGGASGGSSGGSAHAIRVLITPCDEQGSPAQHSRAATTLHGAYDSMVGGTGSGTSGDVCAAPALAAVSASAITETSAAPVSPAGASALAVAVAFAVAALALLVRTRRV